MTDAVNLLTENDPQAASSAIQLLLLLLAITILPSILILMTSFTRIIIVLSFVRTSLATQQMPPNQVLIGLALFLTFFIMAPTFNEVNEEALQPLFNEEITLDEAYESASIPFKEFMAKHTRQKDLALFMDYSGKKVRKHWLISL